MDRFHAALCSDGVCDATPALRSSLCRLVSLVDDALLWQLAIILAAAVDLSVAEGRIEAALALDRSVLVREWSLRLLL